MSLSFCIDKDAIGASENFCCIDGTFSWNDVVPKECWVFKHVLNDSDRWCLKTLFALNGQDVKFNVPEKFVGSMKTCMKKTFDFESVRWQYVLPKVMYSSLLSELTREISQALEKVETSYQERVFFPTSKVFQSLDNMMIDVKEFERLYAEQENPSLKLCLDSFRPEKDGFAKKVVYDRFGSRTGRLTVSSGPEILTLKREFRSVIKSAYDGGKVFYVDFSALEARTFLSAVGQDIDAQDIYDELRKRLGGDHRREVIKLAVLALLYGSGFDPIKRLLGVSQYKAAEFINKIKEQFKVSDLREKLTVEWKDSGGKIRNWYGRVIDVPEENLLINSFVQSTGVDVALLGFLNIINEIERNNMKVRPVAVLHDALLLDCHPRHFHEMFELSHVASQIPGTQNRFYTTVTELACT